MGAQEALEAGVAGAEVELFFFEHQPDAAGKRSKGRKTLHFELILAVPVKKLGKGVHIQPVADGLIKCPQQACFFEGPPLQ